MKTVKIGKFHILELIISGLWISDEIHFTLAIKYRNGQLQIIEQPFLLVSLNSCRQPFLDAQKSLLIIFLAMPDQHATFQFYTYVSLITR